jgi:hypothetical protein
MVNIKKEDAVPILAGIFLLSCVMGAIDTLGYVIPYWEIAGVTGGLLALIFLVSTFNYLVSQQKRTKS